MEAGDYDSTDPERHLKRVNRLFGVSSRIQELVKKSREAPRKSISKEDKLEVLQKNVKEQRADRKARLGIKQNFMLELAATHFGTMLDLLAECAADSEKNTILLEQLFEPNGIGAILIQLQIAPAPGIGMFPKFSLD